MSDKKSDKLIEFWNLVNKNYYYPSSHNSKICKEYRSILQYTIEILNARHAEFKDFVNEPTEEGNIALILACKHGHDEIITLLIDWGSDIHHKNNEGCDALSTLTGSRCGYLSTYKLLLENGANPNTTDKINSYSPLFIAAWYGNILLCLLLIEYGADLYQEVSLGSVLENYGWKTSLELDEDDIETHRNQLIAAFTKSNLLM